MPATISGEAIRLSASIGVAWQVKNELSGRELVRQADLAMYGVKSQHRQNPRPPQTESAWASARARGARQAPPESLAHPTSPGDARRPGALPA